MLDPKVPKSAKSTVKAAAECTVGAALRAMGATNTKGISVLSTRRRRRRRAVSHSVLQMGRVTGSLGAC